MNVENVVVRNETIFGWSWMPLSENEDGKLRTQRVRPFRERCRIRIESVRFEQYSYASNLTYVV